MKAILEFDLYDHDDRWRHDKALKGADYYSILHDIWNVLRSVRKYDKPELEAIDEIKALMDDFDID